MLIKRYLSEYTSTAGSSGCEIISRHITEIILMRRLVRERAKLCSMLRQEGIHSSITLLMWSLIGIGEIFLLPLDVLKIKRQTNPEAFRGRGLFRIIADEGFALYRGWEWTAARNAPGSFAVLPLYLAVVNVSYSEAVRSPKNICLDWAIITLPHGCKIPSPQWQEQLPLSRSRHPWTSLKPVSRTRTLRIPRRASRSWGVWFEMRDSQPFSKAWRPRYWRLDQNSYSRISHHKEGQANLDSRLRSR